MRPSFRMPPPVPRGARVRVVATSWSVERGDVEEGLGLVREMGLEPVVPDGLFRRRGFLAGSDAARRASLHEALEDPHAPVVWVARGGSGATRLAPLLDLDLVRRAGKWLVGFSDATALHAAWQRAGWASLHAPNVASLPHSTDAARAEVAACLRGGPDGAPTLSGTRDDEDGAPGEVEAPLLGGNVSVLTALVGTPGMPDLGGSLLLLEDLDEATHRLDRDLGQLRHSGALDGVLGLALGQFTRCRRSHEDARSPAEVVLEAARRGAGLPAIRGLPIGHERSSRPVVLGRRHRLQGDGKLVPIGGPGVGTDPAYHRATTQ